METYKLEPLKDNVEEMFIGPFGSSLKNDCFVEKEEAFCMVYEQKHAIQKTMDVETRYVDERKYNELKRFNIRGGDIIVSCRGTIGETFVVPDDAPLGIMHPSIMKIRLKEGVYDKSFFNDLLYTRLKKHETEANGSGVKMAISANKLGDELFPVPTIMQQRAIEEKIKIVRDLLVLRHEELKKLDDLIKARFVEMFGGISEYCNVGYYIKALVAGKSLASEEECENKVLKTGAASFDYFDAKQIKNLPLDYVPQHEHLVNVGDIIISRMNTAELTGAAAYVWDVPENVYLPDRLWKAVLQEDCNPIFVWQMLIQSSTKEQIRHECSGTSGSMKNISKPGMLAIKVKKVPFSMQNQFADYVRQVVKSKVAVQAALDKAQLLFDSLMQEYFG